MNAWKPSWIYFSCCGTWKTYEKKLASKGRPGGITQRPNHKHSKKVTSYGEWKEKIARFQKKVSSVWIGKDHLKLRKVSTMEPIACSSWMDEKCPRLGMQATWKCILDDMYCKCILSYCRFFSWKRVLAEVGFNEVSHEWKKTCWLYSWIVINNNVKGTSRPRKNLHEWIPAESTLKKPLGQGRIHISEFLPRAR